jgi:hypothetical protein
MNRILCIAVLLFASSGFAAPSTAQKAKCSAALSAIKGIGAKPDQYEKRHAYLKACSVIFSDLRQFVGEQMSMSSPYDYATMMLKVSTGEGERKSYCALTKTTDLSGCEGDGAGVYKLPAAEVHRQWKILLARILKLELGEAAGASMMKDFEAVWADAFPIKE